MGQSPCVVDCFTVNVEDHLRALEGADERLHLFDENLLEERSIDTAIDGYEWVFHTASPFYHDVTDPGFILFFFSLTS